MGLKVYVDMMSQPSRAVLLFLQNCNIPYEKCPVKIIEGEHLTDSYKKEVSRFQKVPVIKHDDFTLTESVAIVRYLAREYHIKNNWYPIDSKAQARVDEYLEWQHVGLRTPCMQYFLGGIKKSNQLGELEQKMIEAINTFDRLWLNHAPYIAGKEISIADIFASCELEQPTFLGYNPADGRKNLSQWWTNVRNTPHYEEIHTLFRKLTARYAKL